MSHCEQMVAVPRQGHCHRCDKKLHGRRTRWCSTRCNRWWTCNHRYTQARQEARRRARWSAGVYRCAHCLQPTTAPEVNHITPCLGKHGVIGCHHHQENLEVLCHSCHLAATAEQRASGAFSSR